MLKGKTIIITGASSGIGKALALEFASNSCELVISGRNLENLEKCAAEIRNLNAKVLVIQADVAIENDCKRLIEQCIREYGKIDVLINNAGISMRSLVADTDISVIQKVMDTNFWGTVYCSKFALPHLLKSKGSVIGISSIAGYKGLPARCGYSASKFAMHGFLESLRIENLKTGLHVLIACPGFTASNIRNSALKGDGSVQGETPRNEDKMMQAEEVAREIVRALEKRRNSLILTRQGKLTVWINKFFPNFVDKQVFLHLSKEPDSPFK